MIGFCILKLYLKTGMIYLFIKTIFYFANKYGNEINNAVLLTKSQ